MACVNEPVGEQYECRVNASEGCDDFHRLFAGSTVGGVGIDMHTQNTPNHGLSVLLMLELRCRAIGADTGSCICRDCVKTQQ